jgi:hypothetical protein
MRDGGWRACPRVGACGASAESTPKHSRMLAMLMPALFLSLNLAHAAETTTTASAPQVQNDVQHDLSPKLADMAAHFHPDNTTPVNEMEAEPSANLGSGATAQGTPRALPRTPITMVTVPNPFHVTTSFDGIGTSDLKANGLAVSNFATDSSGAVGPNHFVQAVNFAYAIYDKNGSRLVGPLATAVLWSGFNAPCGSNWSDVVVLYDHAAGRWFVSRFAYGKTAKAWYQCFAISQTADPTGAYYRYAFEISQTEFNDYPKFGIWPDAYYMTADRNRIFKGLGVFVAAFERQKMLQGATARMVLLTLDNGGHRAGMLPADWDGESPPPAGTPNYLVRPTAAALGWPADSLELWRFHVDWQNPMASTLTRGETLSPPLYRSPCGQTRGCIPQAGTTERLDSLAYGYLMYRLAYRDFGNYQSLVLNYTVEIPDVQPKPHAGVRWFELRKTPKTSGFSSNHQPVYRPWSIYQHGDYAPDANHRWIGSIAQDREGNIALGYDVSGPTLYPSIAFAGRLAKDPLGMLSQETTIQTGGGPQTGYVSWGDYSQMSIDPSDGCTFWYVNTYQPSNSANQGWATRIAAFRLDSCSKRFHPPTQQH